MLLSTTTSSWFVLREMCIEANMARNRLPRSNHLAVPAYRGHWNRFTRKSVVSRDMERTCNWAWVESAVSAAIADWNSCALSPVQLTPLFHPSEQEKKEAAYDQALLAVEREAKLARRVPRERREAQRRIVAIFPRFASLALGLEDQAVHLLTDGFLPIGTQFAQWAKRFDPSLPIADTIQACRNASSYSRIASASRSFFANA